METWYASKLASLKRSHLLFAISEYTRQEAINIMALDPNKIVTITAAPSDIFRPIELSHSDILQLKCRYRIGRPYIMYNGGIENRKNVTNLLLAYALLPPQIQSSYDLVLVGKSFEQDKTKLTRLILQNQLAERVIITGYVPDDDLVALYNHCSLFVFPSFLEGFGMPPLEAMACGAATIASNTTSLPEVIGLANALFDPTSPQSIANKIASVLLDTHFKHELQRHALKQAKKFSWDAGAKKAIDALEQCRCEPAHKIFDIKQDTHYQTLIKKIASLPRERKIPSEADYIAISQAIDNNRKNIL